jgi:hypothetical protein
MDALLDVIFTDFQERSWWSFGNLVDLRFFGLFMTGFRLAGHVQMSDNDYTAVIHVFAESGVNIADDDRICKALAAIFQRLHTALVQFLVSLIAGRFFMPDMIQWSIDSDDLAWQVRTVVLSNCTPELDVGMELCNGLSDNSLNTDFFSRSDRTNLPCFSIFQSRSL